MTADKDKVDLIRLEDARGCLEVVDANSVLAVDDDGLVVVKSGATWKTLQFTLADRTSSTGHPVYQASEPAIGLFKEPWGELTESQRRLVLPGGWHAPEDRS